MHVNIFDIIYLYMKLLVASPSVSIHVHVVCICRSLYTYNRKIVRLSCMYIKPPATSWRSLKPRLQVCETLTFNATEGGVVLLVSKETLVEEAKSTKIFGGTSLRCKMYVFSFYWFVWANEICRKLMFSFVFSYRGKLRNLRHDPPLLDYSVLGKLLRPWSVWVEWHQSDWESLLEHVWVWNLEKMSFSIAAFPPRNSGHFGHEANGISNVTPFWL